MPIFEITFSRPLRIAFIRPLERLVGGEVGGQLGAAVQVGERVEHQVRVDGGGAVADQRREVVDLARLAGLDHEAGLQPRALADQVLVDGAERQHRRDRHPVGGERRGRR